MEKGGQIFCATYGKKNDTEIMTILQLTLEFLVLGKLVKNGDKTKTWRIISL